MDLKVLKWLADIQFAIREIKLFLNEIEHNKSVTHWGNYQLCEIPYGP